MSVSDKTKYKKLLARHRQELVKIAKETAPWEYGYTFQFIVEHLKMMMDYYKLGYNVWGEEDPNNNRLDIAQKLIYEYEAYLELPSTERKLLAISLKVNEEEINNKLMAKYGGNLEHVNDSKFDLTENESKFLEEKDAAEEQHYKNFIALFGDKIRYLWD